MEPEQSLKQDDPTPRAILANDRAIGSSLLVGSIIGIIVYGLLVYYWPMIVLQITAFLAVAVLLGILAWIGYTMATTPPPEPITDIPEPSGEKKA
jgi:predicted DNA-binding transcriptional regulator